MGLSFEGTSVVRQAVAALHAGKHLLLQGAPGTGKTSLAEAISGAAIAANVSRGFVPVTGSSDWSPSDTVGTYRMNRDRELEFVHGHLLDAIATERWVVLDELNRADIDRAMGPFFSVLSGKPTILRYEEAVGDDLFRKVAIVPQGQPIEAHVNYEVGDNWRIIATMNTKDLDLLFEVSQAFLRRFAVITVPCPAAPAHRKLLASLSTGDAAIDEMVQRLVSLPGLELGPAITLDCASYARTRKLQDDGVGVATVAAEMFDMFVAPQLTGFDSSARSKVLGYVRDGPQKSSAIDGSAASDSIVEEDDAEDDSQAVG